MFLLGTCEEPHGWRHSSSDREPPAGLVWQLVSFRNRVDHCRKYPSRGWSVEQTAFPFEDMEITSSSLAGKQSFPRISPVIGTDAPTVA
jgi:hypothetical protein